MSIRDGFQKHTINLNWQISNGRSARWDVWLSFNIKCFCRARWLKSAPLASVRRDSLLTTPLSAKHSPATPPLPNPLLEPGNHVEKPRSVERCMAWRRGTCGAQRAAGRRPASASLTEIYALPHFKTCSFHGLSAGVFCTLSEWTSWAEMCPSEACGHLKCHWFLQATRGALFLPLP